MYLHAPVVAAVAAVAMASAGVAPAVAVSAAGVAVVAGSRATALAVTVAAEKAATACEVAAVDAAGAAVTTAAAELEGAAAPREAVAGHSLQQRSARQEHSLPHGLVHDNVLCSCRSLALMFGLRQRIPLVGSFVGRAF